MVSALSTYSNKTDVSKEKSSKLISMISEKVGGPVVGS
jgi:hypothetical protein